MAKYTEIPNGASRVIFKRYICGKEYLYIELDNSTIKILNTLDNVKDYVYVKRDELDNTYEISLKPFKVKNCKNK